MEVPVGSSQRESFLLDLEWALALFVLVFFVMSRYSLDKGWSNRLLIKMMINKFNEDLMIRMRFLGFMLNSS